MSAVENGDATNPPTWGDQLETGVATVEPHRWRVYRILREDVPMSAPCRDRRRRPSRRPERGLSARP